MSDEIRIKHFLKELEYLTEKYGIEIGGCGCCGSPYFRDLKNKKYIGIDLEYDEEKRIYEVVTSFNPRINHEYN